jgi:hypothetical protein
MVQERSEAPGLSFYFGEGTAGHTDAGADLDAHANPLHNDILASRQL